MKPPTSGTSSRRPMSKQLPKSWTGPRSLQRQRKGSEKSARSDKRSFVEGLAAEVECAAARGELSTVYKIKRLCGDTKARMAAQLQPNANRPTDSLSTSVKS